MSSVSRILSLLSAASMMVSGALDTVAPQHDADGLLFLVNREYTVSEAYEPADLEMSDVPGQVRRMRPAAAEALREMFQACKEETGKQLLSISGYRSYAKQSGIYNRKLRSVKKNVEKAQEYVAPPGASEHQTGMAMDVGQKHKVNLEVSFGETEGGKWCRENCWRFGFILRYGEIFSHDLPGQVGDTGQVFLRLRGQSVHEVQLHAVPSALKGVPHFFQ